MKADSLFKTNKIVFLILCATFLVIGCGKSVRDTGSIQSEKRRADESRAAIWLKEARKAVSVNDFQRGRILIDSIRRETRLALDAREWSILLLDSIELREAQIDLGRTDSMVQYGINTDSLTQVFEELVRRVKFYQRKLEHDRTNWRKH